MFSDIIYSTAFTTDPANALFGSKIFGGSYVEDVSFVSTLRAMVYPRMSDEDTLNVLVNRGPVYSAETLASTPVRRILSSLCYYDIESETNMLLICNVGGAKDIVDSLFEIISTKATTTFEGYTVLEKVTAFYRKSFKVVCLVNPTQRTSVLFVESLSMEKLHYLQCSIFAILPWYFDPEKGVSKDEMALIQSFRQRNPNDFFAATNKLAEAYDFRESFIRQKLSGFENRFVETEKRSLESEISEINHYITELQDRMGEQLREVRSKQIRLLGIVQKLAEPDSGESEIMEYFLVNKNLVVEDLYNEELRFAVKSHLEYYDDEIAEKYILKDDSYFYRDAGRDTILRRDMKMLLKAIFIDEILKIRICAAYRIILPGRVAAMAHHAFGPEFANYLPNPHVDAYNCMGNYPAAIVEFLRRGDYVGAIEQCVASAKSLNFNDSTVMNNFMQTMYGTGSDYNNRCIETPDGKILKPKEAILWLKENVNEEETEKKDE